MNSVVRLPEPAPQLYHPSMTCITLAPFPSLGLSFLACKMDILMAPPHKVVMKWQL